MYLSQIQWMFSSANLIDKNDNLYMAFC